MILSLKAYFVILRGDIGVGDFRITMGGVRRRRRADWVFLKTTVMEMGQPPSVADEDPAVWGELTAVHRPPGDDHQRHHFQRNRFYNYSRGFPTSGRRSRCPSPTTRTGTPWNRSCCGPPAHAVVDDPTAHKPSIGCALYAMSDASIETCGLLATDNWLELSVRFVVPTAGSPGQDAISREIPAGLDAHKITIASATYDDLGSSNAEPAGRDRTSTKEER